MRLLWLRNLLIVGIIKIGYLDLRQIHTYQSFGEVGNQDFLGGSNFFFDRSLNFFNLLIIKEYKNYTYIFIMVKY